MAPMTLTPDRRTTPYGYSKPNDQRDGFRSVSPSVESASGVINSWLRRDAIRAVEFV